jgi:hypothetical protein
VIAVFTKYDQFRRDISIKLEDQRRDPASLDTEVKNVFNKHYLASFTEPPPFVRLESENFDDHETRTILSSLLQGCTNPNNNVMALSI